jgi:hypothetical protein
LVKEEAKKEEIGKTHSSQTYNQMYRSQRQE